MRNICVIWIVALAAGAATAAEEGRRYDLVKRASEIDPAAREHPEIGFTFADGMRERARQFLLWLARENPAGAWKQFLTADDADVRWEKVIIATARWWTSTMRRPRMAIRGG